MADYSIWVLEYSFVANYHKSGVLYGAHNQGYVKLPYCYALIKGKDHVAAQIRKIAEENNVPLVPDPPLARELYRVVEVDQMIPADLYAAVAQVLAFVYRMAARKRVAV